MTTLVYSHNRFEKKHRSLSLSWFRFKYLDKRNWTLEASWDAGGVCAWRCRNAPISRWWLRHGSTEWKCRETIAGWVSFVEVFNFGFCGQPQFGACLRRVEVVLIHGFNWSKSFTAIMGTLSKRLQIHFEWVVNFEAINESHILLSLFNDRSVKQLLNKFKNLPKNKTLMFPLFSTYR